MVTKDDWRQSKADPKASRGRPSARGTIYRSLLTVSHWSIALYCASSASLPITKCPSRISTHLGLSFE